MFNFDYIGISEVFSCEADLRLHLTGYQKLITRTRKDDCHGGVGLFIKESINYTVREDLSVFNAHVIETLFIEVSAPDNNTSNHIIGVVYRPNTQPRADIDTFTKSMCDILDTINKEKKKAYIMGDYNIDRLNYNKHSKTNEYVDNIISKCFIPLITMPTRLQKKSATLIDHIYSNDFDCKFQSGIIITDVADHYGIFYIMDTKTHKIAASKTTKRIITNENIKKLNEQLRYTDFSSVMNIDCASKSYKEFKNIFEVEFNKTIPTRTTNAKRSKINHEVWMTPTMLHMLKEKNKKFKLKAKHPSTENINSYKEYLNMFNKFKREAKMRYYKNKIELNKNNIKNTWKTIKEVIGKNNDKSSVPKQMTIDGKIVTHAKEIANGFNTFFSNIGKTTGENVPHTNTNYLEYLKQSKVNSMFVEPVTQLEILKIVNTMKPKTSYAHDEISTKCYL